MDEHGMDILERIRAAYYQLTAAERRVADFVLAQHTQVQFMSITQLADECGTAEATVSRFCRSLKLKGFNAFKIELARLSAPGAGARNRAVSTDTLAGRVQELGRLSIDEVHQTMELMDLHQIERAVEMIEKASRVLCIGSGGSMLMASECAHLFSTVTGKFLAIPEAHMQVSAVATMDVSGLIFLFSYSGATTGGLQILELAKQRGIRTILVTRFQKSPAAKPAGWAWVNPQLMIFDDAVQTDRITEGEGEHKKKAQSPFSIHAKTGFVLAYIRFFLPRFCCRGI